VDPRGVSIWRAGDNDVFLSGAVVGRYVDDGFDRVVEQRTTGGVTKTTGSTYDAWDRVATKTDAAGKTTALSYLGLSSQVLAELDKAANKPTDAYTFDAYGQRLMRRQSCSGEKPARRRGAQKLSGGPSREA
jgi:hypothetical protein